MKTQSPTFNLRATVCAVAALLFGTAIAAPGHWYEPERNGIGIQIDQNLHGAGHAVTFYLYREDGSSAFLVGGDNCDSFPCVLALHEPTARYMGGGLNLGPEVGEIEIGVAGDTLPVRFDLRAWQPERCDGISSGGVLFRECAGKIDFELLTE